MNGYTKAQTLLKIDQVWLTLGGRTILQDVNAEIQDIERPDVTQGQVVCFLGPSGIGKTRLTRLIAGLDTPTRGTITVAGHASVGMVPQNYPLFQFATVRQNFEIAGRQIGLTAAATRLKAAPYVEMFDLARYSDLYPEQLSGGTRQRVAIVRQLLCSKNFLVLDEPFSGLDPIMKRRACEVIQMVSQLDSLMTIILVTHDVFEGMSVADTVWLMGCDGVGSAATGARIMKQYDLAELGFAWHPDLMHDAEFQKLVAQVRAEFLML